MSILHAVGTIAYLIDEEALFVRVNDGWKYIQVSFIFELWRHLSTAVAVEDEKLFLECKLYQLPSAVSNICLKFHFDFLYLQEQKFLNSGLLVKIFAVMNIHKNVEEKFFIQDNYDV